MKHTLKRQLRRLATERPYQIVAGSAAALVLASGTGALLTGTGDAPVRQETAAAVAELAPRLGDVATRSQERIAAVPSTSPSAKPSPKATSAKPDPDLTRKAAPKPPSTKVLDYNYEAQLYYYNCGPAAVRNALSATGIETTQDALAGPLGTTEMGTNSAEDTTRGLNQMVKGNPYRTHMIPGAATPAQMDQLQADVVKAITDGRGVVANIAGDATDTDGGWHSFPGGHYIAVVGYKNDGRTVRIADSANPAYPAYWVTTIDLANWMSTRGYSA
ncbi:peptidase C39-like protein [Micromonospora kangleipakensis]|uniref:glutathione gamma-glutamylcysteinyltransferase n=1 Tax=Micromonospora kangleipakensis TaxID=1077942 RepID=A0A4Q8B9V8_9ACTN|nr:C39 family peptidase [Micromonospora kangleipakensis]RZU74530.1 peptidase C39-like protein [Micromonospora kangleipakensis]